MVWELFNFALCIFTVNKTANNKTTATTLDTTMAVFVDSLIVSVVGVPGDRTKSSIGVDEVVVKV